MRSTSAFHLASVRFRRGAHAAASAQVPFGLAVWCTGIKLNPLCESLIKQLPAGTQDNMRSVTTDRNLRVRGAESHVRPHPTLSHSQALRILSIISPLVVSFFLN